MALRVRAPAAILGGGQGLHDPSSLTAGRHERERVSERPGSIAAATVEDRTTGADGGCACSASPATTGRRPATPHEAGAGARRPAARHGYERLLREHRRAWASRWDVCDARIDGDDELQLGARLAIYHLIASTPSDGAGTGRGPRADRSAYRGHVFWDTESYMLPFHAATSPERARAILEYRVARLPAALDGGRASAGVPEPAFRGSPPTTVERSRRRPPHCPPGRSSRSAPANSRTTSPPTSRGPRPATPRGRATRRSSVGPGRELPRADGALLGLARRRRGRPRAHPRGDRPRRVPRGRRRQRLHQRHGAVEPARRRADRRRLRQRPGARGRPLAADRRRPRRRLRPRPPASTSSSPGSSTWSR